MAEMTENNQKAIKKVIEKEIEEVKNDDDVPKKKMKPGLLKLLNNIKSLDEQDKDSQNYAKKDIIEDKMDEPIFDPSEEENGENYDKVKYIYFLSKNASEENFIDELTKTNDVLITDEIRKSGYFFKINRRYLKNKSLPSGFLEGISFLNLNDDEDDDEILDNMDNDYLNIEKNCIYMYHFESIYIDIIIQFYELYAREPYLLTFRKGKAVWGQDGGILEEHFPKEPMEERLTDIWLNFLYQFKLNAVFDYETPENSLINRTIIHFVKDTLIYWSCPKMTILFEYFYYQELLGLIKIEMLIVNEKYDEINVENKIKNKQDAPNLSLYNDGYVSDDEDNRMSE